MRKSFMIILGLVAIGCSNPKTESKSMTVDHRDSIKLQRLKTQEAMLLNKKIGNLREVFGDTVNTTNSIILLYTGFDCGSCVESGFRIANAIDLTRKRQLNVVEIQSNKGADQISYNYSKYIFTDKNDLIRKSLKFVKTPVLIFLDQEGKINNVYYPESHQKVDERLIDGLLKNTI